MADDELKAMLGKLLAKVETLATKDDVSTAVAAAEARLNAKIETVNAKIDVEARVINARLDEQGRILAAMVPIRLAAVPPERQAS
jgi:hypothetical protein